MKRILFLTYILSNIRLCGNGQCICDPDVEVVFNLFKEKAEQYNAQIEWRQVRIVKRYGLLDFGTFKANGVSDNENGVIEIDATGKQWKENGTYLIFHELGHFYLNRQHYNAILDNSKPASIMSEFQNVYLDSLSEEEREYYFKELFTIYERDVPDSLSFFKKSTNYFECHHLTKKNRKKY